MQGQIKPDIALIKTDILKSVLYFTGSQCKDAKIGEMLFLFFVPVSSLAAAFWTTLEDERLLFEAGHNKGSYSNPGVRL